MKHWMAELEHLLAGGNDVIRVVVAATGFRTARSGCRDAGVSTRARSGTLGGGQSGIPGRRIGA